MIYSFDLNCLVMLINSCIFDVNKGRIIFSRMSCRRIPRISAYCWNNKNLWISTKRRIIWRPRKSCKIWLVWIFLRCMVKLINKRIFAWWWSSWNCEKFVIVWKIYSQKISRNRKRKVFWRLEMSSIWFKNFHSYRTSYCS